jgi:histidine triad (HIT) family protein
MSRDLVPAPTSGSRHMTDCVFCRIAGGHLQADVIWEDDLVIAITDLHPIRPGHALIISRAHFPYFEDLPQGTADRIVHLGRRLARAMKLLYGVPQVAFMFTGGDLPHAHAHVVPMHEKTDITSRRYIVEDDLTFRPTPRAAPDELAETAARLRQALARD